MKYNIPDMESYLNMDYRERNNMFYEVIKHFKICVVPSQKNESFDHLPHFMIIEDNLKLIKQMPGQKRKNTSKADTEKLKQTEQKNKLTRFDPRNVKGNIELFQHINELQMLKYRKQYDPSESLKVKKRKKAGKYSSIVEDFGIKNTEVENQEEQERKQMEADAKNNTSSPVKLNDSTGRFSEMDNSNREFNQS